MKRFTKTVVVLMLVLSVLCTACMKDEEVNDNGSGNGGGESQYYSISISANPTNGGTVSGGGSIEKGQSCTITATPATDYVFKDWTGRDGFVSSNVSYTFTVTGDRDLVANFIYNGSGEHPTYFTIDLSANPVEGGSVWGSGRYSEGESCIVEAVPENAYTFINWTDENGNVVSTDVIYTFPVECNRSLVANFSHNSIGSHEYVDLGLPSGTLWATCNVGANKPEDYGDYYAWGETQTKPTFDLNNYLYFTGADLTKYCNNPEFGFNGFTDNLIVLQTIDDAASARWGSGWCIPTHEQWEELKDNTTITLVSQNGVSGHLITASNGASLFLPSAGYKSVNGIIGDGSFGNYWSSSLYLEYPDFAWIVSSFSGGISVYGNRRYDGQSVRAVCVSKLNGVFSNNDENR